MPSKWVVSVALAVSLTETLMVPDGAPLRMMEDTPSSTLTSLASKLAFGPMVTSAAQYMFAPLYSSEACLFLSPAPAVFPLILPPSTFSTPALYMPPP